MFNFSLRRFLVFLAVTILIIVVSGAAVFASGGGGAGAADNDLALLSPGVAFSGTVSKQATLPTTATFTLGDFTARCSGDGAWLGGITIIGSSGIGGFSVNDTPYAMGTLISRADIGGLAFKPTAAGTATFTAAAYDASALTGPAIGGVTVSITVSSGAPRPQELDEITYDVRSNSYAYFDDRDFNNVFNDLTGRNVYYVRFTQPSSSRGRLYYNYSSDSSYDFILSSSDSFYRSYTSSNTRIISNVAIVPADDYYGSFSISYTAYDESHNAYNGTLRIRVDETGESGVNNSYTQTNTVTYFTEIGVSFDLSSNDFNTSLSTATGLSLSHIRFTSLPAGSSGRLLYNYNTSVGSSSGSVSTDTRYYRNANPDISLITFVPAPGYAGNISIPYTAYATNNTAYAGTMIVRVGQTSSSVALADLNYTVGWNTTFSFKADDIQSALTKAANMTLSYIIFTELPGNGAMYFNYRGASNYDSVVSSSTRYFRSTNPLISNITFVPDANKPSAVTIRYIAYSTGGTLYNGKIIITPAAAGKLKPLTYMSIYGEPLNFGEAGIDGDIRAQVRDAAARDTLSHVVFAVPRASVGTLYTDYNASPSRRKEITEGEQIKDSGALSLSDLTFVAETDRNIRLDYTAYTSSGAYYDGRITIKPVALPDGWAHEEVGSLAMRGIVPDRMLSDYGAWITRAEFTALLVRTYNYSGAVPGDNLRVAAFEDILGNPYARFISRGFSLGIIDGETARRFNPDAPITREAAAKILCATLSQITGASIESDAEIPYEDIASMSEWALPYIAFAYEHGLMIGGGGDIFNPQSNLTREEAMAITERMIVNYGI